MATETFLKLEECYDEVVKCKKCGEKYGYDLPSKYIKKICGKKIKLSGYKDNMLCPICDPNNKDKKYLKPKHLNTSENLNNQQ